MAYGEERYGKTETVILYSFLLGQIFFLNQSFGSIWILYILGGPRLKQGRTLPWGWSRFGPEKKEDLHFGWWVVGGWSRVGPEKKENKMEVPVFSFLTTQTWVLKMKRMSTQIRLNPKASKRKKVLKLMSRAHTPKKKKKLMSCATFHEKSNIKWCPYPHPSPRHGVDEGLEMSDLFFIWLYIKRKKSKVLNFIFFIVYFLLHWC